jgi:hypothetical protein
MSKKRYYRYYAYNFTSCFVWCETEVSHSENNRLNVFENKALRRIFGLKIQ